VVWNGSKTSDIGAAAALFKLLGDSPRIASIVRTRFTVV
jgi:hypothetical protein